MKKTESIEKIASDLDWEFDHALGAAIRLAPKFWREWRLGFSREQFTVWFTERKSFDVTADQFLEVLRRAGWVRPTIEDRWRFLPDFMIAMKPFLQSIPERFKPDFEK